MPLQDVGDLLQRGIRLRPDGVAVEREVDAVDVGVARFRQLALDGAAAARAVAARRRRPAPPARGSAPPPPPAPGPPPPSGGPPPQRVVILMTCSDSRSPAGRGSCPAPSPLPSDTPSTWPMPMRNFSVSGFAGSSRKKNSDGSPKKSPCRLNRRQRHRHVVQEHRHHHRRLADARDGRRLPGCRRRWDAGRDRCPASAR